MNILISKLKSIPFRSLLPFLIIFSLFLTPALSACTSMFDKDFFIISDYEDNFIELMPDSSVQEVWNYATMKSAILNLVKNASDFGTIKTKNYSGNAPQDVSRACIEVANTSPIGFFSVDYMSHVIRSFLTYMEIDITITYKRSPDEINSIIDVNSAAAMFDSIDSALSSFSSSIILQILFNSADDISILDHILARYRSDPLSLPELPRVSVSAYPSWDSIPKIIEISSDFSLPPDSLRARLDELALRLNDYKPSLFRESLPLSALAITEALIEIADPFRGDDNSTARTAFGALVNYAADSEGYAMAFKLLCNTVGINSIVVEGRLGHSTHFWNIVELDGSFYHVDPYTCDLSGIQSLFLKRDADLWSGELGYYWWDTENVPICAGDLSYDSLLGLPPDADPLLSPPSSADDLE